MLSLGPGVADPIGRAKGDCVFRKHALVPVLLSGLSAGCSGVDLEAERRAVLAADRAFAQSATTGGAEAWVEAFAEDGALFPQAGMAVGPDEIRRIMEVQFRVEGMKLSWEPTTAVVGGAADLAYTLGRWRLENVDPRNPMFGVVGTGNYVMI
jgi:ketosteroid isomerase-like protein